MCANQAESDPNEAGRTDFSHTLAVGVYNAWQSAASVLDAKRTQRLSVESAIRITKGLLVLREVLGVLKLKCRAV